MDFLRRWKWELGLLCLAVIVASGLIVSELGHRQITEQRQGIMLDEEQTKRVIELRGLVSDVETGQRGYLLTGREEYLVPYREGVLRVRQILEELAANYNRSNNTEGSRRVSRISTLVGEKFGEMEIVLQRARQGETERAIEIVQWDLGHTKMAEIRKEIDSLITYNTMHVHALRQRATEISDTWRLLVAGATAINVLLLIFTFVRLGQAWRAKERQTNNMLMQQAYLDSLVQERTRQLEDLSAHLQDAIESEKLRLARELHDELGSILTAAKMDVSWVHRRVGKESGNLAEKLDRAIKNIDQGITVKRRLIEDLRPSTLSSFGLLVAARELAKEMATRNEWQLHLELPEEEPQLQPDTATALYRILQESLNNTAKYARAKSVAISLVCDNDELTLDIIDDGIGFNVNAIRPKALGLIGMKQRVHARGGTFNVHSEPGQGCRIRVVLPLRRQEQCDSAPDGECKTEIIQAG